MEDTDFPDSQQTGLPLPPARLPLRRLVVRFAVMALALVVIDVAIAHRFPAQAYEPDWRLPEQMPTAEITRFVAHIDEVAATTHPPLVAFIGASPTWGDAVKTAAQTVPAQYRRSAESSGTDLLVYNLAANGQLMADEYFVARRAARVADTVFVQLTYHGFNSMWREGAVQRYPELPRLLGVRVDRPAAAILGLDATPRLDVTGAVDRWLAGHWRLWGGRDAITSKLFKAPPEVALHDRWLKAVSPDFAEEMDTSPDGRSFDDLLPDEQMMMIDQFSGVIDYRLDPADPEVRIFEKLAADLARSHIKAVFYLSPINIEALKGYDAFNAKAYASNVSTLRRIAEKHGQTFIDMNDEPLPSSAFADINHTTVAGSKIAGRELWRRAGVGR